MKTRKEPQHKKESKKGIAMSKKLNSKELKSLAEYLNLMLVVYNDNGVLTGNQYADAENNWREITSQNIADWRHYKQNERTE